MANELVWSVFSASFPQLRQIAQRLLSRERDGHTLQPTALVNEAFLKLQSAVLKCTRKEEIFYWSAYVMRQVLIDSGRGRSKRVFVSADTLADDLRVLKHPEVHPDLALAIKVKYELLKKADRRAAEALWMRYVEEKTIGETALAVGRTPSQVRSDCAFALRWMADQFR